MGGGRMPNQSDMAPYLFHQGTNYRSFEFFGVHKEGNDYVFRVWAPNAYAAYVVGNFNGWCETHSMERITDLTKTDPEKAEIIKDITANINSRYE